MARPQNEPHRPLTEEARAVVAEVGRGRRVVVRPDNRIETEPFTPRAPEPGELLIRTLYTLISAGTELGLQENARTQDFSPGYSNVGRILALGEGVAGYAVGDVVLSLGNHATHVTCSAAPPVVAPVPAGVRPEEATFGVLGSVAAHGVRRARIELGEYVLITGMGVVGQLALQLAAQTGCEALMGTDLSDARLEIARAHGATHALNPHRDDLAAAVHRLTNGRGLDCVIEASGYPDQLPLLFDLARIGGRIVLLGSIWHRTVELDLMPFHLKELTLLGVHQPKCPAVETPYFPWTQPYNRRQMLKMIGDGRLQVRPLITHLLPFTHAAEAYRLLREERDKALGVVLDFTAAA
jgi:2-desacetyl-2-hydroxyethyl bacteriochlorophyllide A dehydrogenase